MAPNAATEILVLSPTPNSTRNSGNIADAGVERKKSTTNSTERYSLSDEPRKMPSGMAMTAAISDRHDGALARSA